MIGYNAHIEWLPENELYEGEIAAYIFKIGCYEVRYSYSFFNIYHSECGDMVNDAPADLTQMDKNFIIELRNSIINSSLLSLKHNLKSLYPDNIQFMEEISARTSDEPFISVCKFDSPYNYFTYSISGQIINAKQDLSCSDHESDLYVTICDNSSERGFGFKMSYDGHVEKCDIDILEKLVVISRRSFPQVE